jgi:NAD(P)-dependent dehydrogenase (short-subunit alcohol dehydrogenase family)
MKRFKGKPVLVTRGNSGIGLATAQAFWPEGARGAISGRDRTLKALISQKSRCPALFNPGTSKRVPLAWQ